MAAGSIQISSRVQQGIPTISAGGSCRKVSPSQFLGPGRIRIASAGGLRRQQPVVVLKKVGAIRSETVFEKILRQIFPNVEDEEQVLAVYEINEQDRGSPKVLRSQATAPFASLGDLVPYTNKVYDASGKLYLGLSAGLCVGIQHATPGGDWYEVTYSHYLGDYGQLSAMGPYYTTGDSEMVVTGGTGIFKGARGIVKIHSIVPPIKLLYTYYISGIQKLPKELTIPVVPLPEDTPKASTPAVPPPADTPKASTPVVPQPADPTKAST